MQSAILGAGLFYLLLLCVFLLAFAVMWVVLLVRAALSSRWTMPQKIMWLLAIVFFPPVTIIYALKERSGWWKAYAFINLALAAPLMLAAAFGDHH